MKQFQGSRAIGFWSHFMFGMERNQQADDEVERTTTTFRVLKDRYTGRATGATFPLSYERDTGIGFETPPKTAAEMRLQR
jgi:twinkle protein